MNEQTYKRKGKNNIHETVSINAGGIIILKFDQYGYHGLMSKPYRQNDKQD